MALSDGSREQVLQEAQFLNGIATNLFATGVLGTVGTYIFASDISDDKAFIASAFGMLCFFGCFALHLIARLRLRELDR
jgi:hypothetical protein